MIFPLPRETEVDLVRMTGNAFQYHATFGCPFCGRGLDLHGSCDPTQPILVKVYLECPDCDRLWKIRFEGTRNIGRCGPYDTLTLHSFWGWLVLGEDAPSRIGLLMGQT